MFKTTKKVAFLTPNATRLPFLTIIKFKKIQVEDVVKL